MDCEAWYMGHVGVVWFLVAALCWAIGVCGVEAWCGVVWGLYGLRIFYPYIFNVGRANADALRGSMKYQLTCLSIRLFKCGYRI